MPWPEQQRKPKYCTHCGCPIPTHMHRKTKTCSEECRQARITHAHLLKVRNCRHCNAPCHGVCCGKFSCQQIEDRLHRYEYLKRVEQIEKVAYVDEETRPLDSIAGDVQWAKRYNELVKRDGPKRRENPALDKFLLQLEEQVQRIRESK